MFGKDHLQRTMEIFRPLYNAKLLANPDYTIIEKNVTKHANETFY